jgi:hypothetical protein
MVRDKLNILLTRNVQIEIEQEEDQVKAQEIDIPPIPVSAIPIAKDPSSCCGS